MMTMTSLTVKSRFLDEQGIVMLSVHGTLDSHTYSVLESKLDRLIYHGESRIIIDLADIDFLTSAGVNVFLAARRKASNEHGTVVLMNPSETVRQVFELLPASAALTVAMDLESALKLFA